MGMIKERRRRLTNDPLIWNIFVQAIGFVAAGFGIFSYQARERKNILLMQAIGNVLWLTQFFLLGDALAGAVLNTILAVRAVIFIFKDKLGKLDSPLLPAFFGAVFVIAGAFIYKSPVDIFPVLGCIAQTIALYQTDTQKVRLLSLFSSPCWLVYDSAVFTLAGILTESFSICSIIIAFIRNRKKGEK